MAKAKKATEPVKVRLKKNDLVEVTTGKEQGKTGKVLKVFRKRISADRKGQYHQSAHPSQPHFGPGGIVEKEAPVFVCKVKLICPKCATGTRIRITTTGEGKKARYV